MSPLESILSLLPTPETGNARPAAAKRELEVNGAVLPVIQQNCPKAARLAIQDKNNKGLFMKLGDWTAKKLGFEGAILPNAAECLGRQVVKGVPVCCTEIGNEVIEKIVDAEGVLVR